MVHEAFVKLFAGPAPAFRDRSHFLAVASRAMRQVLVDHARGRRAQRRDRRVTVQIQEDLAGGAGDRADILDVEAALGKLGQEEPRLVALVEMRFLAGMSAEETAEACGESIHTVRRDLRYARARLRTLLEGAT